MKIEYIADLRGLVQITRGGTLPAAALAAGFRFRHPTLEGALAGRGETGAGPQLPA